MSVATAQKVGNNGSQAGKQEQGGYAGTTRG